MLGLGLFYLLISVLLFAVAVVVHFNSTSLSLPISPAISILAAILPIAAFLNAYIHPSTLYVSHHTSPPSPRLSQVAPLILQTLQALVTAVLATLLMEGTVPSPALSCVLENGWLGRYRARDGESIRAVQDALGCCGFNSVRDRAYPFQRNGVPSTCAETYGRDVACRGPWTRAMQTNAGVDLAVVLSVGLLQVFGLLMMREGKNWWTAWRAFRWNPATWQRGSNRPLLTGPETGDEQDEDGGTDGGPDSGPDRGGYGATDEEQRGPRVEPSPMHHERNAWEEH